jgi:HlyD family secretion protein
MTYRAVVHITKSELRSAVAGGKLVLTPGMLVIAEIHQGRRTVLEYLLSPVQKVAQEAARER